MSIPPVQNYPPAQQRSRFVVNLDRPPAAPWPPGAYAKKKRRKWPLALGLVLVLLGVGGFVFWQYYKTRPAYSLALLVDAAQRRDAAAFDRVVDTGKVIESFAPQVINEATGRLGTALTPAMRQRIETLVPTLMPNVAENLRGEVMKQVRELTSRAEGKPFFLIALTLPYIVDIQQQGENATVKAKSGDRNLELTMIRSVEKRWKVVAVKDDELARLVVDDIARFLPAIGADLEDEVRKQVEERLPGILGGGRRRGR